MTQWQVSTTKSGVHCERATAAIYMRAVVTNIDVQQSARVYCSTFIFGG